MGSTSGRTLQLLSLLQGQRYWPGPELAGRLEVSVRTLRRDVERLRALGYPVRAQPGVDGGYQLGAGAVLPPLVLDDGEAVALAIGLQAATSSAVEGMAESAVRALTKVVQVLPPRLRRQVDALRAMTVPAAWEGAGPQVDPAALTAAASACRDDERLELVYVAADGRRSDRTVEPHRLVNLGRRWYLVAYDLSRADWRVFRLDRVEQLHADGTRFRQRTLPAEDAVAFVRRGISEGPAGWEVSAVVHAPVDQVRARLGGWAEVEGDAERCTVTMRSVSLDWAALALGSTGAELEAVTPPELLTRLVAWAGRFSRAT